MKITDDVPQAAHDDVQQPVVSDPLEGRQRTVAEWTGDLLLGMRQPIQFRLADWP
jgi:hypothetical protein